MATECDCGDCRTIREQGKAMDSPYPGVTLYEWMDNLPDGDESALFEDSLAARYPLINRECPFDE